MCQAALSVSRKEEDVLQNPGAYDFTHKIATYEVGEQSTLTLSSLLRLCQQASEEHLAALDLPYERLKRDGFVFLFVRTQIILLGLPGHGETISITTKPCGVSGAQFYRSFDLRSAGTSEPFAQVLQASVLADSRTHKIQRPKLFLQYGVDPGGKPETILTRLALPEELPPLGERPIRYSDLDYNGHLNNAIYADILCDFLPGGMFGTRISELQIDYHSEALYGETLKLYGEKRGSEIWFRGVHERGLSFEARLVVQRY